MMTPAQELPANEWRQVLDEYLLTGTVVNGTEAYARMSEAQKHVIQEIKKAYKRIKHNGYGTFEHE